jgi:glycolate oxidase FAD binding subunit
VTVDGAVPGSVVRPASVAEVQAVVRAAAAEGRALVAAGRGAHLAIGAPPRRLDVLLCLERLDRVLAHEAADMTVTVEAGCSLARLAEVLAAAGQWLPLDPPRPEATTVGGLVAANLSGPLRASQGTVRDLLLGLRVVGADGAVVTGGGRVVKNVAGYDLPKLHVGALGSVGVIVEATFKVRPRPACEVAVMLACPQVRAAADVALAVRDAAEPLWLEIDGTTVVVGLGGSAEEVAEGRAFVRAVAAARGLEAVEVADGSAVRARLAAFPTEPAAAVLRAAVLPLDVGTTLADVEAAARAAGARVRWAAHASCGVARVAVAEPAAVAPLVAALRPRIAAREGTFVVERAAAAVKGGLDVWGDAGSGLDLMRRIKAAFDPAGIFAPGRFVAGL